ncbi:hypothetical protein [Halorhodospira sp. 9622]|uniref:hypothetical protein n=1 Tax=Halorhodospira sp. 9622 TaxID=2899136 RepID=UPI001EE8DECE|nr:hypothetical protein [Halorhodospira sp. 9622]MCG5538988.1 hypothetical protein [Halorhodospira sp. 9622]
MSETRLRNLADRYSERAQAGEHDAELLHHLIADCGDGAELMAVLRNAAEAGHPRARALWHRALASWSRQKAQGRVESNRRQQNMRDAL